MNDQNKKLNVNSSSLVDLKAELIRKQQEFRKEKSAGGSKSALLAAKRAAHRKVSVFSKKNAGVFDRAQKDIEEKIEEDNAIDRSRSILEAKAKLYEKMSTGGGLDLPDEEDEGGGRFLVDFQRKSVDDALQKRLTQRQREEEEERRERQKVIEEEREREDREKKEALEERNELLNEVPTSSDPSEEWVDYIDSFGRSRRCMRKDLPGLIKQDKSVTDDNNSDAIVDSSRLTFNKDLMSEDMYREMLRQKWESEQEELLNTQNTVHYSNVRFDEKRTHGVGFFDFAKDEESRQEQMKALEELRSQTQEARGRKEKLKEKRKAIMAARLAKVRQRKGIKNSEQPEQEGSGTSDEDADLIGPSINEKARESELLTRDETLRRDAPVREWDKGKKDTSAWLDEPHRNPEKSYLESRREERESEFAPPQAYFNTDLQPRSNSGSRSQPRSKVNRRGENADLFSKLDAMDNSEKNDTKSEFGPPSDYFTVPVKKPRFDPMASLERQTNRNSSINDEITSGLSSIRDQVKGKSTPGPNVEVRNIPLPGENTVSESSQHNDTKMGTFHPGQFSMPPPNFSMPPPPFGYPMGFPPHAPQLYPPQFSSNHPGPAPPGNYNYGVPTNFGQSASNSAANMPVNASNFVASQNTSPYNFVQKQQPAPPGTEQHLPMQHNLNRENNFAKAQSEIVQSGTQNMASSQNLGISSSEAEKGVETAKSEDPNITSGKQGSVAGKTATDEKVKACVNEVQPPQTSGTVTAAQSTGTISAAPMMYDRIGSRVCAPVKPRYERVHLHTLPLRLPAPPGVGNAPNYPSQEDVHQVNTEKQEKNLEKNWQKQYSSADGTKSKPSTANIPFPSPYVQNEPAKNDLFNTGGFDPSKPPPKIAK